MSQYPSPYSPPPSQQQQQQQQPQVGYGYDFNYYQPGQDPLVPARRASVMLFIVGGLLAIGGLCCGAVGTLAPMDEIMAQNPVLNSTPGMTAQMLKVGIIVLGVAGVLFGMGLLVLGYFVRGGGIVPVVIAIVLVALAGLFNLFNMGSTVVQLRGAGPELIGGLCVNVVPLVLLIVLLVTLVQAAKAAPRVAMMKSQYQQQYWQYQQQQQMYQAGYVAPPPPQMPESQMPQANGTLPPPVPPASPSNTSSPGDFPNGPSA
jgi:hypothetical protein